MCLCFKFFIICNVLIVKIINGQSIVSSTVIPTTTTTDTTTETTTTTTTRTTTPQSLLPSPTINFDFNITITVDCNSSSYTDQKLETTLFKFFQSYFTTLNAIEIKSSCLQTMVFAMKLKISDKKTIETLKGYLENFGIKLKIQTEKEKLELELKNKAMNSGLDIKVDFNVTISDINNAIDKINKTPFCDLTTLVTCYNNEYFNKTCNKTNSIFKCPHDCERNEYCKNSGTCLPSYADEFRPKCACKTNNIGTWDFFNIYYNGDNCQNEIKSISITYIILIMSILGVFLVLFIAITCFKRTNRSKIDKPSSYDLDNGKNRYSVPNFKSKKMPIYSYPVLNQNESNEPKPRITRKKTTVYENIGETIDESNLSMKIRL